MLFKFKKKKNHCCEDNQTNRFHVYMDLPSYRQSAEEWPRGRREERICGASCRSTERNACLFDGRRFNGVSLSRAWHYINVSEQRYAHSRTRPPISSPRISLSSPNDDVRTSFASVLKRIDPRRWFPDRLLLHANKQSYCSS